MAFVFDDRGVDEYSLDDYIQFVDDHVDIYDEEDVAASAPALQALARNRQLLTSLLNKELANWRDFQATNLYGGQTFLLGLGKRKRFVLRANMWLPRVEGAPISDWERRMFAYGLAHDHNFTLLTVGYLGEGYQTDLYEYDHKSLRGVVEERVELRPLQRVQLRRGRALLMRKSRDVHVQDAPPDISISLNLLIPAENEEVRQLFFDLERGTARDVSEANPERTEHVVCKIAAEIGNDRSWALLHDLSISSRNPLVRNTCAELLDEKRVSESR